MKLLRVIMMIAFVASASAHADELTLCYNWGCLKQQTATFTPAQLRAIRPVFMAVNDQASERTAIGEAVALLAAFAALQSPIANDRGGNDLDDGVEGRMDCIDHSNNTTGYLNIIERQGWLRFHRVLPPVLRARFVVAAHWSARIESIETGQQHVVDTWYLNPGSLPLIMDVEAWRQYRGPHG